MAIRAITSLPIFREVIKGSKPVVVDFWASWCGPCKMIAPHFERLSQTTQSVDFYKVDVDSCPDVSQEAGVRAIPTFMAFRNGTKIGQLVGANPAELEALVKKAS